MPIQTSIGRPRFIAYEVEPWPAVMPWGLLGEEDLQAFRRRYRHRLHRLTPRILAELAELLAKYDGWPLALLCFERDPAQCHRSILAEWLREKGVQVQELS